MRIPFMGGNKFEAAPCLVISPGPAISRRVVSELDGVLFDDERRKAYLAIGSEYEEGRGGGRGDHSTFRPTSSTYVLLRDRAYPVNLAAPPADVKSRAAGVLETTNGHHPGESLPAPSGGAVDSAPTVDPDVIDDDGPANIDIPGDGKHPIFGPYKAMPWSWGVPVKVLGEERWAKARLFDRVAESAPPSSQRLVNTVTWGLGAAVILGAVAAALKVAGILPLQNLGG